MAESLPSEGPAPRVTHPKTAEQVLGNFASFRPQLAPFLPNDTLAACENYLHVSRAKYHIHKDALSPPAEKARTQEALSQARIEVENKIAAALQAAAEQAITHSFGATSSLVAAPLIGMLESLVPGRPFG